jgi:hypothetical protein
MPLAPVAVIEPVLVIAWPLDTAKAPGAGVPVLTRLMVPLLISVSAPLRMTAAGA